MTLSRVGITLVAFTLVFGLQGCKRSAHIKPWQMALKSGSPLPDSPDLPLTAVEPRGDSCTAEKYPRRVTFVNLCQETIWVGALSNATDTTGAALSPPESCGWDWKLPSRTINSIALPALWGGRFWGRTQCTFQGSSDSCETGGCGFADCGKHGAGGVPPVTLAEITFSGHASLDYYDISLVDGFNIPTAMYPDSPSEDPSEFKCGGPQCVTDLRLNCPSPLQLKNSAGKVIACLSACEKTKDPKDCCPVPAGASEAQKKDIVENCQKYFQTNCSDAVSCPGPTFLQASRRACPNAYAYAFDDVNATFTCQSPYYTVVFCLEAASRSPASERKLIRKVSRWRPLFFRP